MAQEGQMEVNGDLVVGMVKHRGSLSQSVAELSTTINSQAK